MSAIAYTAPRQGVHPEVVGTFIGPEHCVACSVPTPIRSRDHATFSVARLRKGGLPWSVLSLVGSRGALAQEPTKMVHGYAAECGPVRQTGQALARHENHLFDNSTKLPFHQSA
jgi:hypothetical protein